MFRPRLHIGRGHAVDRQKALDQLKRPETAEPDAVDAIVDPIWINEVFPERLRRVAASREVREVVACEQGGPLTPALIRQCRGVAGEPSGRP